MIEGMGEKEWLSRLMVLYINTTTYTGTQNLYKHSTSPTLQQKFWTLIYLIVLSLFPSVSLSIMMWFCTMHNIYQLWGPWKFHNQARTQSSRVVPMCTQIHTNTQHIQSVYPLTLPTLSMMPYIGINVDRHTHTPLPTPTVLLQECVWDGITWRPLYPGQY